MLLVQFPKITNLVPRAFLRSPPWRTKGPGTRLQSEPQRSVLSEGFNLMNEVLSSAVCFIPERTRSPSALNPVTTTNNVSRAPERFSLHENSSCRHSVESQYLLPKKEFWNCLNLALAYIFYIYFIYDRILYVFMRFMPRGHFVMHIYHTITCYLPNRSSKLLSFWIHSKQLQRHKKVLLRSNLSKKIWS